ncbi:hypothetical protein DKM19_25275 [Streptosporangium sp. 'caverna']|nr:hypothetical protein DKM19_25275 [Streptosporangium sp. 'caverna']
MGRARGSHVVEDGDLVTGRDPAPAKATVHAVPEWFGARLDHRSTGAGLADPAGPVPDAARRASPVRPDPRTGHGTD